MIPTPLEQLGRSIHGLDAVVLTVKADDLMYQAWTRHDDVYMNDDVAGYIGHLTKIRKELLLAMNIPSAIERITLETNDHLIISSHIQEQYLIVCVFQRAIPLGIAHVQVTGLVEHFKKQLPFFTFPNTVPTGHVPSPSHDSGKHHDTSNSWSSTRPGQFFIPGESSGARTSNDVAVTQPTTIVVEDDRAAPQPSPNITYLSLDQHGTTTVEHDVLGANEISFDDEDTGTVPSNSPAAPSVTYLQQMQSESQDVSADRVQHFLEYVKEHAASPDTIHTALAVHAQIPLGRLNAHNTLTAEEFEQLKSAAQKLLRDIELPF